LQDIHQLMHRLAARINTRLESISYLLCVRGAIDMLSTYAPSLWLHLT